MLFDLFLERLPPVADADHPAFLGDLGAVAAAEGFFDDFTLADLVEFC